MAVESTANYTKKGVKKVEATGNFKRNEAYVQRRLNTISTEIDNLYRDYVNEATERAKFVTGQDSYYDNIQSPLPKFSMQGFKDRAKKLKETIEESKDFLSGESYIAALRSVNGIIDADTDEADSYLNNYYNTLIEAGGKDKYAEMLAEYAKQKDIEKKYGIDDSTGAVEIIGIAEGINTNGKQKSENAQEIKKTYDVTDEAKKEYNEEKSRIEKEYGVILNYDDYEGNTLILQDIMNSLPAGEEKQKILDFSKIDPSSYDYESADNGERSEEEDKQKEEEEDKQKEKEYLRYLASQRINMDDWNALNKSNVYGDIALDYKSSAYNSLKNNDDFAAKSNITDEQRDTLAFDSSNLSQTEIFSKKYGISGELLSSPFIATYDEITQGMSDDEVKVFNYLINTQGVDAANDYRQSLNRDTGFYESVGARKGKDFYEKNLKGHPILTALYSVPAGFFGKYAGSGEEILAMVQGEIPKDKDETETYAIANAKQEHGDGYNTLIELGMNIGNNLPKQIIGTVTGKGTLGDLTVGATAAAQAYEQAIDDGYSVAQARGYAVITGVSEALLEKLLGGIAGMTGKITGKTLKSAVENIEKAGLRMLATHAINMAGEFTEEYLQEILDPVFRNIMLGEDNEFKPFTADALYAGMLGALSAASMNIVPVSYQTATWAKNKTTDIKNQTNIGRAIAGTDAEAQVLAVAQKQGIDTKSASVEVTDGKGVGKIISKIRTAVKNRNVGKLSQEVIEKELRAAKETAAPIVGDDTLAEAVAQIATGTVDDSALVGLAARGIVTDENIGKVTEALKAVRNRTENAEVRALIGDIVDTAEATEGKSYNANSIYGIKREGDSTKYILEDGTEVDSGEVGLTSKDKTLFVNAVQDMTDGEANEMIAAYRKYANGTDKGVFATTWGLYRTLGETGAAQNSERVAAYRNQWYFTDDSAVNNVLVSSAIEQGVKARARKAAAESIKERAKKVIEKRNREHGAKGEVRGEQYLGKNKSSAKTLARTLARLGYDVEFLSEDSVFNGKRLGDTWINGAYDADTNTIYLRADAHYKATDVRGILAHTLAHEITHSIETWSESEYNTLTDYIREALGADFDTLVKEKMNKLNMGYRQAADEVTADGCEMLLRDSKALEKLATENANLFVKIGEKIREFISKLRKAQSDMYGGKGELHDAAVKLREALKSLEGVQEVFDRALISSVRNMRTALAEAENAKARENLKVLEKQAEKEGLKLSEETEDRYADYDKPITVFDVEVLHSIERKSINSFTSEDIQKSVKWAYKFYKELGTKSPFFRAWFGEWRAHDIAPVNVVDVPTIDISEASLEYGDYSIRDTQWTVHAGNTLNDDTRHHSGGNRVNVKSLNAIERILDNAILLDTVVSTKDKNKKSANTAFMHKLYTPIEYDGKQYLAVSTVEEFYNETEKGVSRKAYNLKAIKIEPAGGQLGNNSSSSVPNTGSIKNVSDLYALVKRFDKDFTAAHEVNPVLLNDDGTPKVFYHGTGATFTEFRAEEMRAVEGSYFFAENREDAEAYGKNVMSVYLTGENLADYDNQPSEFYKLKNKREQVKWLKDRGYDGWYADMDSGGWGEVSVFSPSQVKSATDNIGTYDKGNNNILFSVEYTTDNKPVAVIEENILANVPKSQWVSTVKNTIHEKFSGGIPISGRLIKVNSISRNEFTKSKYSQYLKSADGTIYRDKFKSANNLDDIVLASTNYINEDLKHDRNDNFTEFARGDVLVRVGGNDYSAKVIVGLTSAKQMVLYDVVDFARTSFKTKKEGSYKDFGVSRNPRNELPSGSSISDSGKNVNSKLKFSEETGDEVAAKTQARLKGEVERLRELVKLQSKLTHGTLYTDASVRRNARALIEKYNTSNRVTSEVTEALKKFYAYIASSENISWEDINREAGKVAAVLQQNEKALTEYDEERYSEIKSYLRERKIYFPENIARELKGIYGSGVFSEKLFGKVGFTTQKGAGTEFDTIYNELSDAYPDLFPAFDSDTQEAAAFIDGIDALFEKLETLYETDRMTEEEKDAYSADMTFDIYDSYFSANDYKTVADKWAKKVELEKIRTLEAKRETAEAKGKLRQALKDAATEKREALRSQKEKYEAAAKGIKDTLMQREENRRRREIVRDIAKRIDKLDKLAKEDSKTKHIPSALREIVKTFREQIDSRTQDYDTRIAKAEAAITDLERRRNKYLADYTEYTLIAERIKQYDKSSKEFAEADARMGELKQSFDRYNSLTEQIGKKLSSIEKSGERSVRAEDYLSEVLSYYKTYDNADSTYYIDVSDLAEAIEELRHSIGERPLYMLTADQLEDVLNVTKAVQKKISDANRLFKSSQSVSDRVDRVVEEAKDARNKKVSRSDFVRTKQKKAADSLFWNNLKPYELFKQSGSEALYGLYRNLQKSEGDSGRLILKYAEKYRETAEKYGIKEKMFNEKVDITFDNGKTARLTGGEVLTLYLTSKRGQGRTHLLGDGFRLEGGKMRLVTDGKETVYENADMITLTENDLTKFGKALDDGMRSFGDEMQKYMSTVMAADGNAVSMKLYDIMQFGEENYITLTVDNGYLKSSIDPNKNAVKLKNSKFTMKTVANATQALSISSFVNVFQTHAADMATYAAFTLPLEDITKVINGTSRTENGSTRVRDVLGSKLYGEMMSFLTDVNGGIRKNDELVTSKLFGAMKAARVGLNLRVIVQQPCAIMRALAELDPQYFIGSKTRNMAKEQQSKALAEMTKYASTWVVKALGGVDINTKQSIGDTITDLGWHGNTGKHTIKKAVQEGQFWAAEKADQLTWCWIWTACKNEVIDKFKKSGRAYTYEDVLKAAGDRFDEVTNTTQVYDSVFSRSKIMRDGKWYAKFLTMFMAEPMTTLNMAYEGVRLAANGQKGKSVRIFASLIANALVTAAAAAVVDAARDDDEDKNFGEKYLQAFIENSIDNLNPFLLLPFYKDLYNLILHGFDVDRPDVEIVGDMATKLLKLAKVYGDDSKNAKERAAATWDAISILADMTGVAMTSFKRDFVAIYNTITTKSNWQKGTKTTTAAAAEEAWKNGLSRNLFEPKSDTDKLYYAYMNDDEAYVDRTQGRLDDTDFRRRVIDGLKDNDYRIAEAAAAHMDGDFETYDGIIRDIANDGFNKEYVVAAVISAENKALKDEAGEDDDVDTVTQIDGMTATKKDIFAGVEDGDYDLLEEYYRVKTDYYKEKEKEDPEGAAFTAVRSLLTNNYKEQYQNADEKEREQIRDTLLDIRIDGHKVYKAATINKWDDE